MNLYRYTRNNPLSRRDPYGLYSSSGNEYEIDALETYYKDQDFGIDYCEKQLKQQMAMCEINRKKNEDKELEADEKVLEKAVLEERLKEHERQGRKRLSKIRDDILKGRR